MKIEEEYLLARKRLKAAERLMSKKDIEYGVVRAHVLKAQNDFDDVQRRFDVDCEVDPDE